MSIASEIQRLQQAKADLKNALSTNGADPGDGTIDTYPSKITDVYNAGYSAGQAAGGGDSYYDEFWDSAQENGNRKTYNFSFAGTLWNDVTFKPKYNIVPGTAINIFTQCQITNLKSILEQLGVTLDFSNCTAASYMLQQSSITDIGVLDFRSMNSLSYNLYRSEKLQYVEKIILRDDGGQTFNASYSFGSCGSLERCIFEGCIGQQNFNIQWSTKLDKESLLSILNCLKDYSEDTSGTIWTITIGTANMAKLTAEELEIAYNKGWMVN